MDRRGQAFTVEAVLASLLLVSSLVFALQMTAVTPLSASGSSPFAEDQRSGVAAGVLDAAVANASVKGTVLYWNDTDGAFHRVADGGAFVTGGPPTRFGSLLNRSFEAAGLAFNVEIRYLTPDGALRTKSLVAQGGPSDGAVRAVRTVTLYDDDRLREADGSTGAVTLESAASFYAPDAAPDSYVYNVVRVEVVAWRT